VIGGGPAGIVASAILGEAGRRVVLLDESAVVGGQIWRHRAGAAPTPSDRAWIARLQQSGAEVIGGAAVVDVRDNADVALFDILVEREIVPLAVQADTILLATGARERFLPFPGWTLPGVMGVGGAQALLKGGMPVNGKRVVIAGSGPLLLPVASSLVAAGARVKVVAEQAPRARVVRFARGLWRTPAALVQAARYRAGFRTTPYLTGTWVTSARGEGRVEEVTLTDGKRPRTIACDMCCAAYGLVPERRLATVLGCEVSPGGVRVDELQRTSHPRVFAAGEVTGIGGVDMAIIEARVAASALLGKRPSSALLRRRATLSAMATRMEQGFALRDELRHLASPDTIVCRCEDVTRGALQGGWTTRQAKLYTRIGMGACQARICGAALEFICGWPEDTSRAPVVPALVSTLLAQSRGESGHPARGIAVRTDDQAPNGSTHVQPITRNR
jgi:NADPH-dependent 2,4-dienoyl-CoA reductase/sulfur reductase-like enzyme